MFRRWWGYRRNPFFFLIMILAPYEWAENIVVASDWFSGLELNENPNHLRLSSDHVEAMVRIWFAVTTSATYIFAYKKIDPGLGTKMLVQNSPVVI